MTPSYVLLASSPFVKRESIVKIFAKLFQNEYELIDLGGGRYKAILNRGVNDLVVLQASFRAASGDLLLGLKGLIVPCFSSIFLRYLDRVEDGKLTYVYEIGYSYPSLYEECAPLLDNLDSEIIYTAKVYIESEKSRSLAALSLYVHRNTVGYRISRFEALTGICLDTFANEMFVYNLIRVRKLEIAPGYE